MEPIWTCIVNGLGLYEKSAVLEDGLGHTAQDEDGEVLGFESLVSQFWEFLACVLEKKSLKSLLKSHLAAIVYIAIGYMQITVDQEEVWESDPNEYVAEEEDLFTSFSVRQTCLNLVVELTEEFEMDAIKALVTATGKRIEESSSAKQKGSPSW
jgi:hypothetical protein